LRNSSCYGESIGDYLLYPLEDIVRMLKGKINVDCLVVHPVEGPAAWRAGSITRKRGRIAGAAHNTGAGDLFNAGFLLGWMNGMDLAECLMLGVYSSGYYVRYAKSPTTAELAGFMLGKEREMEKVDK
jgi:sugar/nucleoside kinase (ribokinase family)